jgi:hypothetical protein
MSEPNQGGATPQQNRGASLDELLAKLRNVELALDSLNSDLQFSQDFLVNLAAVQQLRSKPGAQLATPSQVKCLELIERYFEVYRRYLKSPLGDQFSGSAEANPAKLKSSRSWWPSFGRTKH